jgi:hypothetical protein
VRFAEPQELCVPAGALPGINQRDEVQQQFRKTATPFAASLMGMSPQPLSRFAKVLSTQRTREQADSVKGTLQKRERRLTEGDVQKQTRRDAVDVTLIDETDRSAEAKSSRGFSINSDLTKGRRHAVRLLFAYLPAMQMVIPLKCSNPQN